MYLPLVKAIKGLQGKEGYIFMPKSFVVQFFRSMHTKTEK